MKKTSRSHCSCNVAIQCLAPKARPLLTTVRYMVWTMFFWHSRCSTQITWKFVEMILICLLSKFSGKPPISYKSYVHMYIYTLQWPLDLSSMMQPDGRFLHFTKDASIFSSTLSIETSTIAHCSALNCLQYRTKYTSLVGTKGVSICSSANICNHRPVQK